MARVFSMSFGCDLSMGRCLNCCPGILVVSVQENVKDWRMV